MTADRDQNTVYKNFCWTKISPSPATFVIFDGIKFRQCGKGRHILNVIWTKNSHNKTIRADGEIGGIVSTLFTSRSVQSWTTPTVLL